MSKIILATLINLLATVLPMIGVDLGTDKITDAAQTIIAIGTGIWIWYERVTQKRVPEVNILGAIKR